MGPRQLLDARLVIKAKNVRHDGRTQVAMRGKCHLL